MPVGPERLTRAQLKEMIDTDRGSVSNSRFKRRLSARYGGFFETMTRKEERALRRKTPKPDLNSDNRD